MARKLFAQLKPATQERKLKWFAKHEGLSPSEVRSGYDAGTLSQKGARGHRQTREHAPPIKALVKDGKDTKLVTLRNLTKSERSEIAYYWNTVKDRLNHQTGWETVNQQYKIRPLDSFEGKTFDGHELETREEQLDQFIVRNEDDLEFEKIYEGD